MQSISVGASLIELVTMAYGAGLSILLHGRHGIGKSEIMAAAAERLGVAYLVIDLSIMEPTDLVGIPRVDAEGQTVYARPAFLPRTGKGILMFEELNRSPCYMQAPCLQLLTARRFNSYVLPAGWLPCAAVNDSEGGYFVQELDPALLSRFLNVSVEPDVTSWAVWARLAGVHEKIIDFVRNCPGIFSDPQSNPRAWHYASRFLRTWEQGDRRQELLAAALAGFVGDKWALAFIRVYSNPVQPLEAEEIVTEYALHRSLFKKWVKQRELDVVMASLNKLKRFLQPQSEYESVVAHADHKTNVQDFFADLPPDIQLQVREWLNDRNFRGLTVKMRTKGDSRD